MLRELLERDRGELAAGEVVGGRDRHRFRPFDLLRAVTYSDNGRAIKWDQYLCVSSDSPDRSWRELDYPEHGTQARRSQQPKGGRSLPARVALSAMDLRPNARF